jgi:TolA-binding protein
MTSNIDPTKPPEGKAYTADVRANFQTAHDEISALQTTVADLQTTVQSNYDAIQTLQGQVATLQSQVADLEAQALAYGTSTWQWQAAPQAGSISNGRVGLDTATAATATTLWITATSDDNSDYTAAFVALAAGDELVIWERKNSGNNLRFSVTGPAANFTTYFTVPVSLITQNGVEPTNNQDAQVRFLFP